MIKEHLEKADNKRLPNAILTPLEIPFKDEGRIKTFPDSRR